MRSNCSGGTAPVLPKGSGGPGGAGDPPQATRSKTKRTIDAAIIRRHLEGEMDGAEFYGDGNLRLAFSTWVYQLHAAGIDPADGEMVQHCSAVDSAENSAVGDEAGLALVRRASTLLEAKSEPPEVLALARQLYGDRVSPDLGEGSRLSRTIKIRQYQFGGSFPWLARIYERQPDGTVSPTWLLVEQVTDRVRAMDPNPWNDIDEERLLPLQDFLVLWELDECTSVHLR
jgi:hypothetical protein